MKKIIKKIYKQLPEGFVITLSMENGGAQVELYHWSSYIKIPGKHKTLTRQLKDALRLGKEF